MDVEKLKVDESLWPDGATHYCEQSGKFGIVASAMRSCCIPRPKFDQELAEEKIHEILRATWSRELSADDALDAIKELLPEL